MDALRAAFEGGGRLRPKQHSGIATSEKLHPRDLVCVSRRVGLWASTLLCCACSHSSLPLPSDKGVVTSSEIRYVARSQRRGKYN